MMKVNLFISNSKKYIKKISAVFAPVLFLLLLFIMNRFWCYLIIDDTKYDTRLSFHEMKTQEENIDVLFLGSSHCYRSLDTAIADDIFDANTFNGGSSSQSWDGSYAVLVEAGKKNDLKKVYVEMYYNIAGEVYWEREALTSVYLISDYLDPSVNKVRYLVEAGSPDHWIDGFFPARRYWQKFFSEGHIANVIAKKQTDSYKNYEYWGDPETDLEYYGGKGYIAKREGIENYDFSLKDGLEEIPEDIFSADDIKSIRRIIDYCEKNDIELVFFSAPMPYYNVLAVGNYGSYIGQVEMLLAESGVPYYDFNLCREEYFSYDCTLFKDEDHLGAEGAEQFTKLFAEFFAGEIEEKELFYDSYEEKVQSIADRVYGINYSVTETETEKRIAFETVEKGDVDCYASVYKKVSGGEVYEELTTLARLDAVTVPVEEQGELQIDIYEDEQGSRMMNRIYINY